MPDDPRRPAGAGAGPPQAPGGRPRRLCGRGAIASMPCWPIAFWDSDGCCACVSLCRCTCVREEEKVGREELRERGRVREGVASGGRARERRALARASRRAPPAAAARRRRRRTRLFSTLDAVKAPSRRTHKRTHPLLDTTTTPSDDSPYDEPEPLSIALGALSDARARASSGCRHHHPAPDRARARRLSSLSLDTILAPLAGVAFTRRQHEGR